MEKRGAVKVLDFTVLSCCCFATGDVKVIQWCAEQQRAECTSRESSCSVIVAEGGQPLWSLMFIDPVIIMGLIMECVTINPPVSLDCVIVLQSQRSSRPTTATMTSCCGRREACSGDQAGGFWEGLRASPGGAVFSGDLLNSRQHTDVAGLRFQRFYIVWAFQKQTLTGKGP